LSRCFTRFWQSIYIKRWKEQWHKYNRFTEANR